MMEEILLEIQNQVAVIIPSLRPDEKLLSLLDRLQAAAFQHIIIINDGSESEYKPIFEQAEKMYHCTVLTHPVNRGKGCALKTAFRYLLDHRPDLLGAITVDADGQHRVEDILHCAEMLEENPDKLILGCRDFAAADIPARSRIGNIFTRKVLRILCGIRLTDTQTGLRGIPLSLLEAFIAIPGERFEYEMNMLLRTKKLGIGICEVPIQTIYLEENASSHFNPFVDSLKIYFVFLKFILSSLASFLVDIVLFTVFRLAFQFLPYCLIISTLAARVISSLFNFTLNKKRVFHSEKPTKVTIVKYFALCVVQVTISALSVNFLSTIPYIAQNNILNPTVVKILIDSCLFVGSYFIQKWWVFGEREAK